MRIKKKAFEKSGDANLRGTAQTQCPHTKVLPIYECSTEDTKSEQRQGMRRKFPEDQVGQQENFFPKKVSKCKTEENQMRIRSQPRSQQQGPIIPEENVVLRCGLSWLLSFKVGQWVLDRLCRPVSPNFPHIASLQPNGSK